MKYFTPLLPFIAGWALLLTSDSFATISLTNGLLQLALFGFVVCIPIWKTHRMSYVDIGWPFGLTVIGALTWFLNDGDPLRTALVSIAYLAIGSRMGFGALKLWSMGRLKQEFPRYEYQKRRWKASGKTNTQLAMQVDALWQGLANTSFLAMPAFIIGSNTDQALHFLEITGMLIWIGAFTMESIADTQKLTFLRTMKKTGMRNKVCKVGFWKYSRHPNYFAEWMVWNGLVIAAIPSFMALYDIETFIIWLGLGAGLLMASWKMYATLVYGTGAEPSEYYSIQKRPEYRDYQKTTNRFFPGPVKPLVENT